MPKLFPMLAILWAAGCAGDGDSDMTPEATLAGLLAADSAFAAAAAGTDVAGALEAMFADDVVMPLPSRTFAEGRTAALAAIRANPMNQGARIEWQAVRGGVSADGAHGFTFGYTTLHTADGTTLPGKYLAYWVKRPEGWRVAVFRRGASSAGGAVPETVMAPALPASMVTVETSGSERYRASLDSVERAFSDEAQRIGLGPAFRQYGSEDAVNMGRGAAFVLGADSIAAGFPDYGPSSPVSWAPERVIVASSGDLGVTIGYIRDNASADSVPFFTIWRRATPRDPWRYVAE